VSDCLFCSIVAGEIPATVVLRNDAVVAFRDIDPQAPVHVLVVPTQHFADIREVSTNAPELTSTLIAAAAEVAEIEGVAGAYRLVFNTGAEAGQSVFHVHGHILGGRNLTWPPG